LLTAVLALSALIGTAPSETQKLPFLSPLFTDHMVLQRDKPNTIWGWTNPSSHVYVTVNGHRFSAITNVDGKWTAKIDPPEVGGPYDISIDGPHHQELHDVLVGDVWLCSGQSNMEMGIGNVNNAKEEIAAADYPNIRLCMVDHQIALDPQPTAVSHWSVCSPTTVAQGGWNGFSAAAYFFGRELNRNLDVPIGLVQSCWGGTVAEAWTGRERLATLDDFVPQLKAVDAARTSPDIPYGQLIQTWLESNDLGSKPGTSWEKPDFDDSKWTNLPTLTDFDNIGLKNFDGTVWYRRTIEVPAEAVNLSCVLSLGAIDDADTTFVNGKEVGMDTVYNHPRQYVLPAGTLKAGKNSIAVRVLDTGGAGGFTSPISEMYLETEDHQRISVATNWKYKVGVDLIKAAPIAQPLRGNPNVVTALYNGMIAPLVPLAIKGCIWYQGEGNAGRAYQYRKLLPAMIGDWRVRFNQGSFPFIIVQLANFMAAPAEPGEDAWAELREAQQMAAGEARNSGLATAVDIGDADDIHPKNKQEVGRRLALSALHVAYGMNLPFSGPTYRSMHIERDKIRISFENLNGGLKTNGGPLKGFAVAGGDHKFYWADAKIVNNQVLVWSSKVPQPIAVRYAWAANPPITLYNLANLPAFPFRTDEWPGITVTNK
jgi:sialate O-acetylesterase